MANEHEHGQGRSGAPMRFIDAFDCAARGLAYDGEVPLARLARFAEDLPEQSGKVEWSIRGGTGVLGEPLIHLSLKAEPLVQCQSCLQPMVWPVDEETTLHLVRSEEELDDSDPDEADLEGYDKVLGSARFDTLAQVEDALILAMPYIARHDVCPKKADDALPRDPGPERPHPFAKLAGLKGQLKKD